MIIVVAIMRVISLVCCDEHHNTAAGCKTVCTKACFNLLAKSLDLDICPGQNTTQFLYYACSLEEVFRACCNIPQQVCLYDVLQCKQMLA